MKTHCAQVENLFEAEKPYLSEKKTHTVVQKACLEQKVYSI